MTVAGSNGGQGLDPKHAPTPFASHGGSKPKPSPNAGRQAAAVLSTLWSCAECSCKAWVAIYTVDNCEMAHS